MDTKRVVIGAVVAVYAVATIALLAVLMRDSQCTKSYPTHPLLIISLDGFWAQYMDQGVTPTLQALADGGVKVAYMKASYPTLTFPNHYTIATGLYPESHGIIANFFYDPEYNGFFGMSTPDPKWWGGDPIWNTAKRQGKISATYFWPGSDKNISGTYPTYYKNYDGGVPYKDRVDQVVSWLIMPKKKRPDLITLYFEEPDHTGHDSGPDSQEVTEQLKIVDSMIKRLIKGMDDYRITPCVNMIILADHGMAAAGSERVINLPEYIPDIKARAFIFDGSFSRIRPNDHSEEVKMEFMDKLVGQKKEMRVYPKEDLPTRYHFSNNRRIEPIVLDLDAGWVINISYGYALEGQHGYDNLFTSMNALFIASGPDFKTQMETESFQNIELYNLMCHLIGVAPSPNNGTLGSLHHILANPPALPTLPPETKPPTSPYPTGDVSPFWNISRCPIDFNISMPWLVSLNMTEEQQNEIEARHLPWGVPYSSFLPASITLLHHLDHVTGYSQDLKMPLWTSFSLQEAQPSRNLTEMWSSDLRLKETTTATCDSYLNLTTPNISMFPLFPPDFSVNESLPFVPFLVSNSVPGSAQLEARWQVLMGKLVPAWLDLYGPLNLLLGPVFDNDADSFPDNFEHFSIPEVPSDLFAVVTRCKINVTSIDHCTPSNLDAVSFIIPEEEVVSNNLTDTVYLLEFSAKVHDVELVTGLTFFPALDFQPRTSLILRIQSQLWNT